VHDAHREMRTVSGSVHGNSIAAFLDAARDAGWDALAVPAPHADVAGRAELERLARTAGARVVTSVRRLGDRLPTADAVVCMGGSTALRRSLDGVRQVGADHGAEAISATAAVDPASEVVLGERTLMVVSGWSHRRVTR
jgi:sugar phosphate isomerase/epimerase